MNQTISSTKTVAVITSTIGRAELERAIQSVKAQTYPCKHYIFVDGEKYHENAREILQHYPELIVTYLPMNTGAGGWTNSSINAIAPFLVKEDVICYLDDDNWYEPNHIEACVSTLEQTNAPYAYALRNLYTVKGEFICQDIVESIGFYPNRIEYPLHIRVNISPEKYVDMPGMGRGKTYHIDTNCYAMTRDTALEVSRSWYSGIHNDTHIFMKLCELNLTGVCTKQFSVNYIVEPVKQGLHGGALDTLSADELEILFSSLLKIENQIHYQACGNKYPWES